MSIIKKIINLFKTVINNLKYLDISGINTYKQYKYSSYKYTQNPYLDDYNAIKSDFDIIIKDIYSVMSDINKFANELPKNFKYDMITQGNSIIFNIYLDDQVISHIVVDDTKNNNPDIWLGSGIFNGCLNHKASNRTKHTISEFPFIKSHLK